MKKGFYISEIKVTGKDKPSANLSLVPGANVICGASDTGKSYIFQVISYVFGRSSQPKEITEAQGYSNFFIEIRPFEGDDVYTLYRKKDSNDISVKDTPLKNIYKYRGEARRFHAKNSSKKEKTISHFLLELSGLANKRILKNKTDGKTQNFSFSGYIEYLFISESSIIKEGSPFYPSGRVVSRTLEQSTLKMLLSGVDYSDVEDVSNVKDYKKNLGARIEFISTKIGDYSKLKEKALKQKSELYTPDIDKRFSSLNDKLNSGLAELKIANEQRLQIYEAVKGKDERISSYESLLNRFEILMIQYKSDLDRLVFIDEAEHLSIQLGGGVCPVCGTKIDSDHISHMVEREEFSDALRIEIVKVNAKVEDLQEAIKSKKEALDNLEKERAELKNEDELLRLKIQNSINPRIASIRGNMDDIMLLAKIDNNIEFINAELNKLQEQKDEYTEIVKDKKERPADDSIVPQYLLSDLELFIESRLRRWNYTDNPRVTFDASRTRFDIVISGTPRGSSGKGKRSLTYSACVLGLLDYCLHNKKAFPGLVVLDSPVTAFKGKEETLQELKSKKDKLSPTIKDEFFMDLTNTSKLSQIVIFDNEIPKKELRKALNAKIFSGGQQIGRQGFFPPLPPTSITSPEIVPELVS